MNENRVQKYKLAKKISNQIEYLENKKHVQFNIMFKKIAGEKLLEYSYINLITPYKHNFAKTNEKKEVIKVNGEHIYERNVEFSEYYDLFMNERKLYPMIIENILDFEIHFKSITAYHILTLNQLTDSNQLRMFFDCLKIRAAILENRYNEQRIKHMNAHLEKLKEQIFNYADIYCFFNRMSLGNMLTVFTCLDKKQQDVIFEDLKRFNMNFNVQKIPDFINKIFCLVSIRNCVMHSNSLEILIRFYNPKTHELRKVSDRKKYLNMIKELCKEKTHDYS
ncbi:Abi family protein [Coprobacillus sp. AM23-9LB]|nr:Abi family protein [Coprobacillus sp. AM23-9LB]